MGRVLALPSTIPTIPTEMSSPSAHDTLVVMTTVVGAGRDWLPLGTGIIGGVLGIAATYISARMSRDSSSAHIDAQKSLAEKELMASFVSASRTRWIESLRSEVAAFCATSIAIVTDIEAGRLGPDLMAKIDRANHHAAVVSLLVNHEEQDSRDLVAQVDAFMEMVNDHVARGETAFEYHMIDGRLKEIGSATRRITKAEWNRVKRFS